MAIIVAGVIIGGAVYFSSLPKPPSSDTVKAQIGGDPLENIRPVSEADHIRGDINSEVVIIEYSDTECPFCKRFHNTMLDIMDEYEGRVAWVYRHYPIDILHQRARLESVALECAYSLGGNEKFWEYTDYLYETTPSNDGLNPELLPKIASAVGLDESIFESCLQTSDFEEKINADIKNALDIGATGTPWSVVIDKDGNKTPIKGAQPYEVVKSIIEISLR